MNGLAAIRNRPGRLIVDREPVTDNQKWAHQIAREAERRNAVAELRDALNVLDYKKVAR